MAGALIATQAVLASLLVMFGLTVAGVLLGLCALVLLGLVLLARP